MFTHEECLTQGSRAHLVGDGGKFKASRLSNVNQETWDKFKDSCRAASKALKASKAKAARAAKAKVSKEAAMRVAAVIQLTASRRSKKGGKRRARGGA